MSVWRSLEPGEPKDPEGCTLFEIFQAFATENATKDLRARYANGIAWGEMKQFLFEYLNDHLAKPRENYQALMADPGYIEAVLKKGAENARGLSVPFLQEIREAVGIRKLGG